MGTRDSSNISDNSITKTRRQRIAEALTGSYDFFLAGGLTPENVREAMERVRPWGVDVSSGVETDGVKDVRKIAAFAAEVRRADESLLCSERAEGPPR